MCISTDENIRLNRKPLATNNEHDYSAWNINDYDMDLSEYLIEDSKEEHLLMDETQIHHTPAIDETQNFDAPTTTKKRYACPVCEKLWVTPSKLKRHMIIHRREKSQLKTVLEEPKAAIIEPPKKEPEVQCPICFLAIESQLKLSQHMLVHVKSDKTVNITESPLIAHKIGNRYICTVCNNEFLSPAKLQNHMKSQHMRKVSIRSSSKNPIVPEKMKYHRPSNHHAHTCRKCSKNFPSSSKLQRHVETHERFRKPPKRPSMRKHSCLYCEKKFETPSKLQRHQSVHRDVLQTLKSESPPILEISAVTSILGD
jgi:hypothetical protein